jgi:hypothetical protein
VLLADDLVGGELLLRLHGATPPGLLEARRGVWKGITRNRRVTSVFNLPARWKKGFGADSVSSG